METTMTKTNWQDRKHSSHCSGRYGSCGWEFDTHAQAAEYINEQYTNQRPEHVSDFRAELRSNGVRTSFTAYGIVRTATYSVPRNGTMRDLQIVASPSDCVWMIPGSDAMEYCNYYR
jgi:hypothetical protein